MFSPLRKQILFFVGLLMVVFSLSISAKADITTSLVLFRSATLYHAVEENATEIMEEDDNLWGAICKVESGNNPFARNYNDGTFGIAQIKKCVINELNDEYGDRWTVGDLYCPKKSQIIFFKYTTYWCNKSSIAKTVENRARVWCAGPFNYRCNGGKNYYNKICKEIKNLKNP